MEWQNSKMQHWKWLKLITWMGSNRHWWTSGCQLLQRTESFSCDAVSERGLKRSFSSSRTLSSEFLASANGNFWISTFVLVSSQLHTAVHGSLRWLQWWCRYHNYRGSIAVVLNWVRAGFRTVQTVRPNRAPRSSGPHYDKCFFCFWTFSCITVHCYTTLLYSVQSRGPRPQFHETISKCTQRCWCQPSATSCTRLLLVGTVAVRRSKICYVHFEMQQNASKLIK